MTRIAYCIMALVLGSSSYFVAQRTTEIRETKPEVSVAGPKGDRPVKENPGGNMGSNGSNASSPGPGTPAVSTPPPPKLHIYIPPRIRLQRKLASEISSTQKQIEALQKEIAELEESIKDKENPNAAFKAAEILPGFKALKEESIRNDKAMLELDKEHLKQLEAIKQKELSSTRRQNKFA